MKSYGQFCPVAKSAEIMGDPWSLLIVRELLLGSTRFSTLQKGLPRISPTVLNTRLKQLEQHGVLVKRRLNGQRGHGYHLTAAGRELSTVIEAFAVWGMRWARDSMAADDLDVCFLMFDIQRRIDTTFLPDGETVVGFIFPDLERFGRWWLVIGDGEVDLCYADPGKDVDCYITSTSWNLIDVWMGDLTLAAAVKRQAVEVVGARHVTRAFAKWFRLAVFANTPRPEKTAASLA